MSLSSSAGSKPSSKSRMSSKPEELPPRRGRTGSVLEHLEAPDQEEETPLGPVEFEAPATDEGAASSASSLPSVGFVDQALFQQMLTAIAELSANQQVLQAQLLQYQPSLPAGPPPSTAPLTAVLDLAEGSPSFLPGSSSSAAPTPKLSLMQAQHSILNGTPGEPPPIAKCTDAASRYLVFKTGCDKHAIRFMVTKEVAKCLYEGRLGKQGGGLLFHHLRVVGREHRLTASVTTASEVHLPLGDGQSLVMPVQESKTESKAASLKVFPITGLEDLACRVKALGLALAHLYPGAASAGLALSGSLLPQALATVASALHSAALELGGGAEHLTLAAFLATSVEDGLDLYMSQVATAAVKVVEHPLLVSVRDVPLVQEFKLVLAELNSPSQLRHSAQRFALLHPSPPPAPKAPAPAPSASTKLTGPTAAEPTTSAGPSVPKPGPVYPKGFAATHMPTDAGHPSKAPFCLNHLRNPGSCKEANCKFSHGALKANAFSNEAVLALLQHRN